MAARAMTKIKGDWSKLASKLHSSEVPKLNKLKSQVDSTVIKVASLPDSLPKIDWAHYKANVSNPKIVEEIEKKYAAIKVEPPKAPASRLAELQKAKSRDEEQYNKFITYAQTNIESAEVVKTKLMNMIPVQDMTVEDWTLTFPEWSTSIDNPSLGSHPGRAAGLTREEAMAFEQPDPIPFATPTAWKDWEERKKKYFADVA